MKDIFCISGLGADERIFGKLQVPGATLHFIKWLQPGRNESIGSYAQRLCSKVPVQNPILAGVSFGGMMAIEMAKLMPASKVILISSVKNHMEVPWWMHTCGHYKLDRALPAKPLSNYPALKLIRPVQNYFLGAHTAEEKKIANEYRDHVDPVYLRWAINQVLNWKNDWQPENLVHIHGEKDHIFPVKKIRNATIIPGGGHFMIMNKYQAISERIADQLK